jgi:hypothetical protein
VSELNYLAKMNAQDAPPVRVAVCVPSGRQWEADTALRMIAVVARAMSQSIGVILMSEKNSVISFSRNSMAEKALSMGATHIMWVDSDNIPPIDVIKRFLDLDKDIVGSVYCKRVPPYELLGVPMGPVDFSKGGVEPYWLLPGGCIMVKAKVYNSIPKPWYFESIRREGSPMEAFMELLNSHYRLPVPDNVKYFLECDPALHAWLSSEEEENKTRYGGSVNTGEDTNFCLKAHRYGFEIWADIESSYDTGHLGEQTIYPRKPKADEEKPGNS